MVFISSNIVNNIVSGVSGGGGSPAALALEAPITSSDTKAQHAYGVDRMVEGYTGNTLRVERTSDSTQEDFGFDATTGIFDLDALTSWAAGSDVNVVTVYDQVGGLNLTKQAAGAATLLVSGAVKRFGTVLNTADNQLTASTTNGGVGINMGGACYFESATTFNFDTTGGFEVTMLHAPNERKVRSSQAGIFSGNNDIETLFALYDGSQVKMANRICATSSNTDFATCNQTNTIRTIVSNDNPYKQQGQSVISYSANTSTFDLFRFGRKQSTAQNANVITDIAAGVYNQLTVRIGENGILPNILLGGFIISQPYTAAERFAVQSKLSLIGQQHQRLSQADLTALFDEYILLKNINPSTGVATGEKGKLTLNFENAANSQGTPDWDFAYSHPNVGLQGVRSPTRNAANGFRATDTYFAQTATGSMMCIDIPDSDTANELYTVIGQGTGDGINNNNDENSVNLARTHNQYTGRFEIAQSQAPITLTDERTRADGTDFVYDQANQDMGKYKRHLSSVAMTYGETIDAGTGEEHVWDQASWENTSVTQPYLLEAPVFAPLADNIQFDGKSENQFVYQAITWEKSANYVLTDAWATRATYQHLSKNRLYVSDGMSPIGHRDGSIAKTDNGWTVHSDPNARIMTVQNAVDITVKPYLGTRFAFFFATTAWTQDQVEKIQANIYKLLVA